MGWNARCWKCEHYDSVATVEWRACRHPERYTISEPESIYLKNGSLDITKIKPDCELPENYTDHGCPLNKGKADDCHIV